MIIKNKNIIIINSPQDVHCTSFLLLLYVLDSGILVDIYIVHTTAVTLVITYSTVYTAQKYYKLI